MNENRIYVAGPMSGYYLSNFPLFDAAKSALQALGWDVISPADLDRAGGYDPTANPDAEPLDYEQCLARDEAAIRRCGAIGMIPGWQISTGANREKALSVSLRHKTYRCWWEGPRFKIEEVTT